MSGFRDTGRMNRLRWPQKLAIGTGALLALWGVAGFFVTGFSQYISLPALAAFIAIVACQFGPVAISTASMSGRSSSSRKSRNMRQL